MKFIVLGNKSAFTYKGVFPLIKAVRVRVGATSINGGRWMIMPECMDVSSLKAKTDASGRVLVNVPGVCWFTNLRHNVRRSLPPLKTMAENLATNKRLRKHLLEKYGRLEYPRYDNYAAIEVPFVDAIPSDYDGVMGVPVTFLDKWDPDGVTDLVGSFNASNLENKVADGYVPSTDTPAIVNGVEQMWNGPVVAKKPLYKRIVIQPRHELVDANDYRVSDSVPCKPHGLVKDKEAVVDGRPTYCRLLIRPAKEIRP